MTLRLVARLGRCSAMLIFAAACWCDSPAVASGDDPRRDSIENVLEETRQRQYRAELFKNETWVIPGKDGMLFDWSYDKVDLKYLPKLRGVDQLVLGNWRFPSGLSDKDMVYVAACRDAKSFWLTNSDIGDKGIAILARAGERVELLDIRSTEITDASARFFRAFQNLQYLDLRSTAVGDAVIFALRELPKLESLDLTDTAITDACVPALCSMKSLESLNLEGTAITPAAVERLNKALPKCFVHR